VKGDKDTYSITAADSEWPSEPSINNAFDALIECEHFFIVV